MQKNNVSYKECYGLARRCACLLFLKPIRQRALKSEREENPIRNQRLQHDTNQLAD